jgi:hypothetical protein
VIASDGTARTSAAQKRYWRVVHGCSTDLHDWSAPAADDAIARLRERLAAREDPDFPLMIYHAEPFDVACDLADQQLDYAANREVYEAIIRQARSSSGSAARGVRSDSPAAS